MDTEGGLALCYYSEDGNPCFLFFKDALVGEKV
jgi:hypothetical protein